jgi:small conductance mechanosensitive channel
VDVNITHEEDIERAVAAMEEIGRQAAEVPELGRLFLEPPVVLGVEALDNGQICLRLVVKTLPTEQFGVQRQLRRRIQENFTKQGIRLALPRREIFMVEKNGQPDEDQPDTNTI